MKVKRQEHRYETIDLNLTYYPVGYCRYHRGWLTEKLMGVHRCTQRECKMFEKLEEEK